MRKLATVVLISISALTLARAQGNDEDWSRAVLTLQALSATGAIIADWCDLRDAGNRAAHAAGLGNWRRAFSLDEIDARAAGRGRDPAAQLRGRRDQIHARMDAEYKEPASVCGNLEAFLTNQMDPKRTYPAEYKLALSRAPAAEARRAEPVAAASPGGTAAPSVTPAPEAMTGDPLPIKAVVLDTVYSDIVEYRPVILFANGTYTRDANAAMYGNVRPQGHWRSEGNGYWIDNNGRPKVLRATMVARPAKRGETISRHYWSMRSIGGFGTPLVAAFKDYYFSRDGSLRFVGNVSASTNDQRGAPEGTSGVTTSHRTGTHHYSLDGYFINLKFEDGKVQRRLFYFFPDGDKVIGIGAGTYVSD